MPPACSTSTNTRTAEPSTVNDRGDNEPRRAHAENPDIAGTTDPSNPTDNTPDNTTSTAPGSAPAPASASAPARASGSGSGAACTTGAGSGAAYLTRARPERLPATPPANATTRYTNNSPSTAADSSRYDVSTDPVSDTSTDKYRAPCSGRRRNTRYPDTSPPPASASGASQLNNTPPSTETADKPPGALSLPAAADAAPAGTTTDANTATATPTPRTTSRLLTPNSANPTPAPTRRQTARNAPTAPERRGRQTSRSAESNIHTAGSCLRLRIRHRQSAASEE